MDTQCCNEDYFIEGKWVVASPEKKDFVKNLSAVSFEV